MSKAAAPIELKRPGTNFLTKWFGEVPERMALNLWTEDRTSRWYYHIPRQTEINSLVKKELNVYFGLCLGPQGLGKHNRVTAATVTMMPGLWLDLDYGPNHQKKNLPATLEEVLAAVDELPVKPSMIVHSGNGIHVYWKFKEAVIFDTMEERQQMELLNRRWHQLVKNRWSSKGWGMDSVWDLARVLRVPGTLNLKGAEPIEVTLLYDGDEVYNPDDFDPWLPEITEEEAKSGTLETHKCGDLILRLDAAPPMHKFEALRENNENFATTWDHKRRNLKDTSPSGYDMSLALFAARAGWTEQEICDLLIFHRVKWNNEPDLHRGDKYRTTIGRALEATKDDRAVSQLQSEAPENETPEQKRKRVLGILSDTFAIEVVRLCKFNSDPPTYTITVRMADGQLREMTLGTVDKLISSALFQKCMAATCGKRLPDYKGAQWHIISQHLLDSCEEIDMGEEATPAGEMRAIIREYLPMNKPVLDINKAATRQMPFFKGGRLHVWASHIASWMTMTMRGRLDKSTLCRMLVQAGAEPVKIHVTIGAVRTSTSVYSLPLDDFVEWKPKED